MRGQLVLAATCTAMLIVSCSDTGTPITSLPPHGTSTTTTVGTTIDATSSTSVVEPATSTSSTSAAPRHQTFTPPDPFVAPAPTATGGGSGCSPGSGPLPDGVWFGYIEEHTATTIEFDLACYLSCDPGEGFHIGNQNQTTRQLAVTPDTPVIHQSTDSPNHVDRYGRVSNREDFGLNTRAWMYINNGTITHIVLPAARQGCRYAEVKVDWNAKLGGAGHVAFNDLGAVASRTYGTETNWFYWRSDDWQSADEFEGVPHSGMEGSVVAAHATTVAIGAHVHRWTGSAWSTDVFDTLPGAPRALATSGDRVLMTATTDTDVLVHVLTWADGSWSVETITVGYSGHWVNVSGAIAGDTFAIADTGIDSAMRTGVVRVFTLSGSTWNETATLHDQWDTGNWGSSLDLDGDQLLVGADGATPGPGSPGGMYLYTRTGNAWTPEVVGEGGEGFGFSARIDGDTIITAAGHSDATATFWVFVRAADEWRGTPIFIDGHDPLGDWVYGVDILETEVVVSTHDALWIGAIRR